MSIACLSACDKRDAATPAAPTPAASGGGGTPAPADGKEVAVTDATFKAEVLDCPQPVLVDIWATWCGPCMKAGPTIEALAHEYAGKVKVAKLDFDRNKTVAAQYAGNGIPVFLVFKGGKLIHQGLGFSSDAELRSELKPVLDKSLKGS
jgi:thioredoxin 1